MKKSSVAFAAAALLCSSAALAQSVGEKTGVNSTLGITPSTADFVKEAAISDMMEIESSKIAQQKGNAEEKKHDAVAKGLQLFTDNLPELDLEGSGVLALHGRVCPVGKCLRTNGGDTGACRCRLLLKKLSY